MTHVVELQRPGRPLERLPLEVDLVWVGTAHDGKLTEREGARGRRYEFELVPDAEGVRVEVPPTGTCELEVAGVVTRGTLVPWGEAVSIGPLELRFVAAEAERRRGLVLLLPLAVVTLALTVVVSAPRSENPEPTALTLPELDGGEGSCSAAGAGSEARGFEAERLGLAKRERYAFDGKDGIEALPLLREAAACFRDAGRLADAQRAEAAHGALVARIEGDRVALRLAIRAARASGRSGDELAAIRKLERLLTGGGPFADWIAAERREIATRGQASSKSATR